MNKLSGKIKASTSPSEILTRTGSLTHSEQIILEEMNKFFTNIDLPEPNINCYPSTDTQDKLFFQTISERQVDFVFKKLKPSKRVEL